MESKLKEVTGKKRGVKKVIRQVVLILLALGVGFVIGMYVRFAKPWLGDSQNEPIITAVDDSIVEENYILTISNVQEVLKPASDLVSSKYFYTDADTYENYKELFGKKVPFTTDKVVFTYDGVISVGIDLSEVKYDIDNDNKILAVTLPAVKILASEIDEASFEYPFMSDSIFNATGMPDYIELIGKLEKEKADELLKNTGFMDAALANAKQVIANFLTVSDVTNTYQIVFKK